MISVLVAALALTSFGVSIAQVSASLYDELVELYPDTVYTEGASSYALDAARNSVAAVDVLITKLTPGAKVAFRVSEGGTPVKAARWYRMIDVPVEENTGIDSRTEKFSGQRNPYVIRRAPFRVFEALDPCTSPLVAGGMTVALRLEIGVPQKAAAGERTYRISIGTGGETRTLDLRVRVHRATVPPLSRSTISYVNWHTLDNICRDHGVEKWSGPFWRMLDVYAKLMARGRQNTFWLLWNDFFDFDTTGAIRAFHRGRLERYVRLFFRRGLRTVHGCPFTSRESWQKDAMNVIPVQCKVQATSELGRRRIGEMSRKLYAVIRANGWQHRWIQGIFDEPTDEYAERYRAVAGLFRMCMPGIRVIEATMTTKTAGAIDILCPQVQEYQKDREFYDGRKAAGDRVWIYTCLVPGGPWVNRLLDQERLRQVYFGWGCARYGLGGYLHWGFNFNRVDPFTQSVVRHSDGMENSFLPAGDTHIIYARKSGPLSGQRFEAVRTGMEDYELLAQLKAKDARAASAVIQRVFRAFDDYSKDVHEYRSAKRALLTSLDGG